MKIKITSKVPVVKSLRPEIGSEYEVVREGECPPSRTLYFIDVNGTEVGVWDNECEVIEELATIDS